MEDSKQKSLDEKLQDVRNYWTEIVKKLSERMKDMAGLQSLMNEVYIKRQECVEYTSTLLVALAELDKKYKKEYTVRYTNYKMNAQLRYTSDSAINTQIEVDLEDIKFKSELMKIHINAMKETLTTINDIIFGISQRLKIYEMVNGMKF